MRKRKATKYKQEKKKKRNRRKRTLEGTLLRETSTMYYKGVGKPKIRGKKVIYSKGTQRTYNGILKRFCRWLVEVKGISPYIRKAEAKKYIQEYIVYLEVMGRAWATVHTALAALCKVFGKHMWMYKISIPHLLSTKGREVKDSVLKAEQKYAIEAEYCRNVGARCEEYINLYGRNIIRVGSLAFAEIEHGKGGKYQLQLVRPGSEDFVESVHLCVGPDEKIFKHPSVIKRLSTHRYRREGTAEMYLFIANDLKTHPEHRKIYEEMLLKRFRDFGVDPRTKPDMQILDVPYRPRGALREELEKKYKTTEFDRLALMVISVFWLSHWRTSVVMHSYMR